MSQCYLYTANPLLFVDDTGCAPEFSVGVNTEKVEPFKIKVEGKKKPGESPREKVTVELGPVVVKHEKNKTEVGVKAGPVTLSLENGNPKIEVEVGVKREVGKVEVEAKAKIEAKLGVLENKDPYSAGTSELNAEAKIKGGSGEGGVKDQIAKDNIRLRNSGDIEASRNRLADATDDHNGSKDAHTNIKVELQNDPTVKRLPKQISGLRGLKGIWDAIKHSGEDWEQDKETGDIVYKSQDPARYGRLANRHSSGN